MMASPSMNMAVAAAPLPHHVPARVAAKGPDEQRRREREGDAARHPMRELDERLRARGAGE